MQENRLLAALPPAERARLEPYLEDVSLQFEQVLVEFDHRVEHVYFLTGAVTSTIQALSDGSSIETGLMGVEGMVGIQLWLRMPSTPTRTLIQVAGRGHMMRAEDFVREVMGRPESPLNPLVARYTHAFLSMTSQTAACNRLHPVDQRLCRWLKLVHNRVRRDEFAVRQEFLAQMLGVHRPTVSTAANMLQKAGLISYTRGRPTVLDPEGLAAGACECYELMEREMDRIFDKPWRDMAGREDTHRR